MGLSLTLHQLAAIVGCDASFEDRYVSGVVIDSRHIQLGDLFVALKGEHVDGHQFIAQAREAGACAALVSEKQNDELPQLLVSDVRKAFASIAKAWKAQCKAKVVAITGSNGKTSLKEMVTAILRQVGPVTATQGNFNNDLGVPLTVCRINKEDSYAVVEMGTNHHGEIAELVNIVTPDVAVVNTVSAAHIEGFGSVSGVAEEKGQIYAGLATDGIAVVNADLPYEDTWQAAIADRERIRFGVAEAVDIRLEYAQPEPRGSHFLVKIAGVNHHFSLPLPGMHNIHNALAAIAICTALNVPVNAMVKGLAEIQPVAGRLQIRDGINGATLIDDSYNANPASYEQALTVLAGFPGQRWLVLGDFAELGPDAENIHQQLGERALETGVERLFTVGKTSKKAAESFGEHAQHFSDKHELQQVLKDELHQGVVCLIKGSRFMQLDTLVEPLSMENTH